jgi:lysophospholipase L1-like esterase
VSFILGGTAAGKTEVTAEAHREMLAEVDTDAGQTLRFSMTVNVRQPEGEPIQATAPAGTPGLDMYFRGPAPLLDSIAFAPASSPTVLYVAGDSTVCDQGGGTLGGWGQGLPQYFGYGLAVANYADSGESSGSFKSASLWGAIKSRWKTNDYVFIEMGHNDKTTPAATFQSNMTGYVTDAKAAGVIPVLVTPIARAGFSGTTVSPQHINSAGANLPEIIRQIGKDQNVPVIDLTQMTVDWLTKLGPNGWDVYWGNGAGTNPGITHTNLAGAKVIAGFAADAIRTLDISPLKNFLR